MNKESFKEETFITTKDNPYNFFTQFEEWLSFDTIHGYYTLELVGRTVHTSDELSELDQQEDFNYAFDKIIAWHGDLYKKIHKSSLN